MKNIAAFGPADASDTVTSQHASPKGIWSEEFRPCWYLVSIPGVMIVGTLIVVGVRKLARNYLIKKYAQFCVGPEKKCSLAPRKIQTQLQTSLLE